MSDMWITREDASDEEKDLIFRLNILAWLEDNRHWERWFFPGVSYNCALHEGVER